jgi:hypothetical protein
MSKFSEFFPKAPLKCRDVSKTFFDCINENSKKRDALDTQAGIRGVDTCLKEKNAYDVCVAKYANTKKLLRVSPLLIPN